jgi:hypothetical protein
MTIDLLMRSIITEMAGQHKDEINYEIHKRIEALLDREGWYLICSVSDEKIPYTQVRYWSVQHQRCWARPELIDHSLFGYTTP